MSSDQPGTGRLWLCRLGIHGTIPWTDGTIPPKGYEDEWAAIQRDKGFKVVPDAEHVWRHG